MWDAGFELCMRGYIIPRAKMVPIQGDNLENMIDYTVIITQESSIWHRIITYNS